MKTGKPDAKATPKDPEATSEAVQPQQDGMVKTTILQAMERIDPFLRFLTKATGKTSVPLKLLRQVFPKTNKGKGADGKGNHGGGKGVNEEGEDSQMSKILIELTHRGVLNYDIEKQTIGFPLPPSPSNSNDLPADQAGPSTTASSSLKPPSKLTGKGLHGSSAAAAKRRINVLKWTLGPNPYWICESESAASEIGSAAGPATGKSTSKAKDDRKKSRKVRSETTEQPVPSKRKQRRGKNTENTSKDGHRGENRTHQNADEEADERFDDCDERRAAYCALDSLMRGSSSALDEKKNATTFGSNGFSADKQNPKLWLPCQASYAGSHPGRKARYGMLSKETTAKIPPEILQLFNVELGRDIGNAGESIQPEASLIPRGQRRLFLHQARAIESAMSNVHTVVQTATGSGKSFCFLVPVLSKALACLQQHNSSGSVAILLYPTKALAQDQYSKINALLQSLPECDTAGSISLRAGVIDGDTPHSQRDDIANQCQIILTNPDTLHAAVLPNWKKKSAYKNLLARVSTVVVDEAHIYEGAFGAHVAMVLARLKRVCRVASSPSNCNGASSATSSSLLFIACSATMMHPELHFRQLCPIGKEEKVCILTPEDDGSPCAAKHYFVWNPPILDVNGNSTESIFLPKKETNVNAKCGTVEANNKRKALNIKIGLRKKKRRKNVHENAGADQSFYSHSNLFTRRRHAADETAFLLAKVIAAGVRTIAFCKTRSLVEWVYERTLAILQSSPDTSHLTSKVESYRGGYTAEARRSIEERLFQRKLWGVVGTNALELGVDVGGVDLTLHTGYPGSVSLLQQSGRAGRGKGSNKPSCAIMISFSSPSEQYIWKHPKTLLSKGVDAPPTLPINGTVMQGHLLCAGEEVPLTGDRPVSLLLNEFGLEDSCPDDCELLGPESVYEENVKFLLQKGLLSEKSVNVVAGDSGKVNSICVYSTHPVVKDPWKRVSLRSIEPLSYSIVDLSHNMQGGKTDKIHDKAAVMDTIPYSRVFYHAFPGSIIMHRGRKYRIESMESPPPFVGGSSFGPCCSDLLAFAKPTSLQYSTQALSINQITVVKQMEHASATDDTSRNDGGNNNEEKRQMNTVAGNGVVTVKRTVHGYKKLSHVNRKELSRTTISMPPMEFDTYALWIDADASFLRDVVFNFDGGVHALSHAMVAVAPLFVACTSADIDCDHSRFDCTRILLYDQRAGGSGVTAQLYKFVLDALKASVDLLEECTSCESVDGYDGGCPACLQSVPCDNFHQDLCRTAGIRIGKHLVNRLENSDLNHQEKLVSRDYGKIEEVACRKGSAVESKLRIENDMQSSIKPKNIVIGRASWMESKGVRWAEVDE